MSERETYELFALNVERLFVKPAGDRMGQLVHATVGVSGEAGELLDAVKKAWIYGATLDINNVVEETGGLLFYLQALAARCGFDLFDAMRANVEKLQRRYPEGYSDAAARERADKA